MSQTVRIPADVDREDTVLGHLTARQLAILATTGAVLYGIWSVTRVVVPLPLFLAAALPVAAVAALLALGRRDGVSLDRLMLAAVRQHMAPRHLLNAPEGIHPAPAWLTSRVSISKDTDSTGAVSPAELRFPAREIAQTGVVDLGADGLAAVAVCGTVNFALRTPAEQQALVGAFGQYLHSLSSPVQILVRAERLDLSSPISELRQRAPSLPHPALEAAAHEHADYLTGLAGHSNLLRRQVLLVLREPSRVLAAAGGPAATAPLTRCLRRRASRGEADAAESACRAAEARLVRRLAEAEELLRPLGITVTALDAGQTTGILATACNPGTLAPPSPALAGAQDVITTGPGFEDGHVGEWTGPA